jgi:hypothetical protein
MVEKNIVSSRIIRESWRILINLFPIKGFPQAIL